MFASIVNAQASLYDSAQSFYDSELAANFKWREYKKQVHLREPEPLRIPRKHRISEGHIVVQTRSPILTKLPFEIGRITCEDVVRDGSLRRRIIELQATFLCEHKRARNQLRGVGCIKAGHRGRKGHPTRVTPNNICGVRDNCPEKR